MEENLPPGAFVCPGVDAHGDRSDAIADAQCKALQADTRADGTQFGVSGPESQMVWHSASGDRSAAPRFAVHRATGDD